MTVIIDSREKKCAHIIKYFDEHGVDYVIRKLDEGDYQIEGKHGVTVDRKQNLAELSRNLMNKSDHSRFWKEIRRAKEQHEKLYVLVEHGGKIKTLSDVSQWRNKYSGVHGRQLIEEISRIYLSYGVEVLFCDKRQTAKKIIELLMTNEQQLLC